MPRIPRPSRLPSGIGPLPVGHLLVIAYAMLLVGFVVVVLDIWKI